MSLKSKYRATKLGLKLGLILYGILGTWEKYNELISETPREQYASVNTKQTQPEYNLDNPLEDLTRELERQKIVEQIEQEEIRREQEQRDLETIAEEQTQTPETSSKLVLKSWTDYDREKATEALFAEARDQYQNPEYLKNVGSTFITRSVQKEKPVSQVITEKKQYSYLNKGDKNKVKSGKAKKVAQKNKLESKAYKACQEIVDEIFQHGIDESEAYTHYFVRLIGSKDIPKWAKGVKPDKIIEHKGYVTRFYYLAKR